jgi:hypothetical protein
MGRTGGVLERVGGTVFFAVASVVTLYRAFEVSMTSAALVRLKQTLTDHGIMAATAGTVSGAFTIAVPYVLCPWVGEIYMLAVGARPGADVEAGAASFGALPILLFFTAWLNIVISDIACRRICISRPDEPER